MKRLLQWLQSGARRAVAEVQVCMEATDSHHEEPACFPQDQGAALTVANPLLVKRFAESNGALQDPQG